MRVNVPVDEAAGPSAQQQREMDEILSRPEIPAHGRGQRIDQLDRQPAQIEGAPGAAPAAAGERVTVISPSGKRGSIPKAQLQKALSEGYKVAK